MELHLTVFDYTSRQTQKGDRANSHMTTTRPKKKRRYVRYLGIGCVLIAIVIVASFYYSSNTPSNQPSTTQSSTVANPTTPNEFVLTVNDGCITTASTTGQEFVVYSLSITNPAYPTLNYVDGSINGTMTLSNGTTIPFTLPHITNRTGPLSRLLVVIPLTGSEFAQGNFMSGEFEVTVVYKEVSAPVMLHFSKKVLGSYDECSQLY